MVHVGIEFTAKLILFAVFSTFLIEYIIKCKINTYVGFTILLLILIIIFLVYLNFPSIHENYMNGIGTIAGYGSGIM
jgi:hypothetical protein